jgi:hypothetical protein
MLRLVGILGALTFSIDAMAGAGWTGPRAILGLEAFSGGVEIRLAGSGVGCTAITEYGIEKTWTKISSGQDNEKQLLAVLLMAFSIGRAVDIYCSNAADWAALDRIVVVNP